MHWLLTFSLIPLILCTSDSLSAQFALLPVNLSLLQSLIPISRVYFSWNAVSWYLSDTIIFVALLPLILRWLSRATTKGKIIVWTTAFSLYALLWCILPSGYTHAIFYIHPFVRLLDYAVGVQCGLLYMTLLRKEHLLKHVERNRNLYQLGGWALFTSLFCLSFVPSELSLHSVIYLFPACALLIIMAINGGGYFAKHIFTMVRFDKFCVLPDPPGNTKIRALPFGKSRLRHHLYQRTPCFHTDNCCILLSDLSY